jgi:hypothetical protein
LRDGGQPQGRRSVRPRSTSPSQWWSRPAEPHRRMENSTAVGASITTGTRSAALRTSHCPGADADTDLIMRSICPPRSSTSCAAMSAGESAIRQYRRASGRLSTDRPRWKVPLTARALPGRRPGCTTADRARVDCLRALWRASADGRSIAMLEVGPFCWGQRQSCGCQRLWGETSRAAGGDVVDWGQLAAREVADLGGVARCGPERI